MFNQAQSSSLPRLRAHLQVLDRLAEADRDPLAYPGQVGRLVGQDVIQPEMEDGQQGDAQGTIRQQSAHAPLEAHGGLAEVDPALGEDVDPGALEQPPRAEVHARLVHPQAAHHRHDLAQGEEGGGGGAGEAHVVGGQGPPHELLVEEVPPAQRRTEEEGVVQAAVVVGDGHQGRT